jgi:hypothetical protein
MLFGAIQQNLGQLTVHLWFYQLNIGKYLNFGNEKKPLKL